MPDNIIKSNEEDYVENSLENWSNNASGESLKDVSTEVSNFYESSGDISAKSYSENQLSELEDHNISIQDAHQNNFDASEELYKKQSAVEAIGRAVVVGAGKGALTAVENTGYMLSVWDWANFNDDFDSNATNLISDWATEQKKDLAEYAPIYSEDMYDFGFWAQMIESTVDSSVGFAVPGGVAGKAIGRGARFLAGLAKIEGGAKLINGLSTVATGFLSNYAESSMMAKDLYDNVYKNARQKGVSDEEAKKIAFKYKKDFMIENKFWALTDMAALHNVVSPSKLSGAAQNSKLFKDWVGTSRYIGNKLTDAGLEGIEEVGGDFIQKENERQAAEELGLQKVDERSGVQRALDFATSEEGKTSIIGGLMGGPFQSGLSKITSKITDSYYEKMGLNDRITVPGDYKGKKINLSSYVEGEVIDNPGSKKTHKEWLLEREPDLKGAQLTGRLKETTDQYHKGYTEEYDEQLKNYNEQAEGRKNYEHALKDEADSKKRWEEQKELIIKANAKNEEYRNTGKIENTKKEVAEYLKKDAELTEQYKEAFDKGDNASMADINERKIRGLVFRHASKDTLMSARAGDGSLQNGLKNAMEDPSLSAEDRERASSIYKSLESFREEYNTLSKTLKGNKQAIKNSWDLKSRAKGFDAMSKNAISRSRLEENKIGEELKNLESGDISYQIEALKLGKELSVLTSLENNKDINEDAKKDILKKKRQIQDRINEIKELDKDNKVDATSSIKNTDAFQRLSTALEEKHVSGILSAIEHKKYKDSLTNTPKELRKRYNSDIANKIETSTVSKLPVLARVINDLYDTKAITKKDRKVLIDKLDKKKNQIEADLIMQEKRRKKAEVAREDAIEAINTLTALRSSEIGLKQPSSEEIRKLSRKERAALDNQNPMSNEERDSNNLARDERIENIDSLIKRSEEELADADGILFELEELTNYRDQYELAAYEFDRRINTNEGISSEHLEGLAEVSNNPVIKKQAKEQAAEIRKAGEEIVYYGPAFHHDSSHDPVVPDKENNIEAGKKENGNFSPQAPNTIAYLSPTGTASKNYKDDGSTIYKVFEDTNDKKGREFDIEVDENENIKLHLLDTEGNRIKNNFAFIRKNENTSKDPSTLKRIRDKILNAHKNDTLSQVRPKIKHVAKGYVKSVKGLRKNLITALRESNPDLKYSGVKLIINTGNKYENENGTVKGYSKVTPTSSGFVHAEMKAANGSPFPLRLNSRKMREDEANAVFEVIVNLARNAKGTDIANVTGIKGNLSNHDILDLMIFQGSNSLKTLYPFYYDKAKGFLTYGKTVIAKKDILNNKDSILEYLGTMWRTTEKLSINLPMNTTFPAKGVVEWFGEKYDFDNIDYNEFLFEDGALSTNALLDKGILFNQPIVTLTDSSSWGFKETPTPPKKQAEKPGKGNPDKGAIPISEVNKTFGDVKGINKVDLNSKPKQETEAKPTAKPVEVTESNKVKEIKQNWIDELTRFANKLSDAPTVSQLKEVSNDLNEVRSDIEINKKTKLPGTTDEQFIKNNQDNYDFLSEFEPVEKINNRYKRLIAEAEAQPTIVNAFPEQQGQSSSVESQLKELRSQVDTLDLSKTNTGPDIIAAISQSPWGDGKQEVIQKAMIESGLLFEELAGQFSLFGKKKKNINVIKNEEGKSKEYREKVNKNILNFLKTGESQPQITFDEFKANNLEYADLTVNDMVVALEDKLSKGFDKKLSENENVLRLLLTKLKQQPSSSVEDNTKVPTTTVEFKGSTYTIEDDGLLVIIYDEKGKKVEGDFSKKDSLFRQVVEEGKQIDKQQPSSTVEDNTKQSQASDIESKKDDIKSRIQKELGTKAGNRFYKKNPDGENTKLEEVEVKLVEKIIEKGIKDGLTGEEIYIKLREKGFVKELGVDATITHEYLQKRVDGTITLKVGENITNYINAKYDAEPAALKQSQVSEVETPTAERKVLTSKITGQGTDYNAEAITPTGVKFLITYDGERGSFRSYTDYQEDTDTYRPGALSSSQKDLEVAKLYLGEALVSKLQDWTKAGNKGTSEGFKERIAIEKEIEKLIPVPTQDSKTPTQQSNTKPAAAKQSNVKGERRRGLPKADQITKVVDTNNEEEIEKKDNCP